MHERQMGVSDFKKRLCFVYLFLNPRYQYSHTHMLIGSNISNIELLMPSFDFTFQQLEKTNHLNLHLQKYIIRIYSIIVQVFFFYLKRDILYYF